MSSSIGGHRQPQPSASACGAARGERPVWLFVIPWSLTAWWCQPGSNQPRREMKRAGQYERSFWSMTGVPSDGVREVHGLQRFAGGSRTAGIGDSARAFVTHLESYFKRAFERFASVSRSCHQCSVPTTPVLTWPHHRRGQFGHPTHPVVSSVRYLSISAH